MATETQSAESGIKAALNEDDRQRRQERLELAIKDYIKNCKDTYRYPCAALVLDLLGGDANMAEDVIREMRSSFTDILVLLTDPEVAEKFKKLRTGWSQDFGEHLKRMLHFLDWADNKLCYAEMAFYDVENNRVDDPYLRNLESNYSTKQ